MNIDNIYQLLDRYMEGENTQEELCILKKFFKECNNLPDDLLPYRDMFDILETPLPVPTDKELEAFCKVNKVEAICGEKDNLQKGTTKVELKPKISDEPFKFPTDKLKHIINESFVRFTLILLRIN